MSKLFQVYYDFLMGPLERGRFKSIRQELLTRAQGHVLEIGSGTGINFPLYRDVEKVTSIEPHPLMREKSLRKIGQAQVPIDVIGARAEALPFPDDYFDSVVATLVFCTIPNPEKALQEIIRVSKPNAKVLFFEHVRVHDAFLGKLQDWLTPVWSRLCDGCCLDRRTISLIEKEGFQIIHMDVFFHDIFVTIESKTGCKTRQ
ncbi:class I SAM-dependent methyltransferase [Ammoniphilus sp. CFH 90114]|uniref:class I SAM-dependent methyltransferase n=1 Tax=Ammoniphilus sp. CFH 90114 TaxID=2493665 RepID=UPI00100E8B05|nr:class I SAM-dependent methyltransferase [Ammoniphilus sp. CFH 90114]RXT07912.1 class I SAM-dependent methyltransferase [Ammoniphilus sp. CFH 90114]